MLSLQPWGAINHFIQATEKRTHGRGNPARFAHARRAQAPGGVDYLALAGHHQLGAQRLGLVGGVYVEEVRVTVPSGQIAHHLVGAFQRVLNTRVRRGVNALEAYLHEVVAVAAKAEVWVLHLGVVGIGQRAQVLAQRGTIRQLARGLERCIQALG